MVDIVLKIMFSGFLIGLVLFCIIITPYYLSRILKILEEEEEGNKDEK